MPAGKKRTRDAKQKQEEGHKQGCTTFAKHTMRPPSPNASDYCPPTSEDDSEMLSSELDSSDDIGSVVGYARAISDMNKSQETSPKP
jgi:hypothetical protein